MFAMASLLYLGLELYLYLKQFLKLDYVVIER